MDHECRIKRNEPLKSGYWRIVFEAPEIAAAARGGQFVHVKITPMKDRILRRPFSISNADPATGELTVVYKVVGHGTAELAQMRAGESCRILGPLGNAYTTPDAETFPILAAGGYDAFLAKGAGLANLTGSLKSSVFALNSYIPLAMFVLIFLFLFKYDYEEKLPAIIKDNERIEAEMLAKGE